MSVQSLKKEVWAPDPIEGFIRGIVIDIKSDGLVVRVSANKTLTADFDHVFPSEEYERDVDDNCALMHFNSANLLNNIKMRFNRDQIYTYVANIIIAINPYSSIKNLYSKDTILKYKGKSLGALPPHVFAIADQSYRNMRIEKTSQSIIVSGESGAGKTETTKYILQYLTECYGAHAGPIEQRIIESNPLLEAFGNAKTVRNNNSSRSGKFIEIHFDGKLQIAGAFVSHYLLEKSRICMQSPGERNYHIFYRMCAGMSSSDRQKYQILSPDQYNYLKDGTTRYFCTKAEFANFDKSQTTNDFLKNGPIADIQLNDVTDYNKTLAAMKDMGISPQEINDIFSVLIGVLYLGNIEFTEASGTQGGCQITEKGQSALQISAQLLGLNAKDLAESLCNRYTQSGNQMMRIALNVIDAQSARDALAKAIYVQLFEQIVVFVNRSLPFSATACFIGILDIAGFEYFERNDFEQFCINYSNEKLQQFFNQRILKDEQSLYEKEGLGLTKIKFIDNQDCIDVIENKSIGIIDILDEESKLPKPSSENFTNSLFIKNPNNFRLQLPRNSKLKIHREVRDSEGFLIRHYAGAVCYHTAAFIHKNNDALHDSLKAILEASKIQLMNSMFHKETRTSNNRFVNNSHAKRPATGKLTFISVASKFRTQLNLLLDKLKISGSNFIRCIKPNVSMVPKLFEGGAILSQLECSGTTTVLDLMQQGYPSRIRFLELYNIYSKVLPKDLVKLEPKLFCKLLFKAVGLNNIDYLFGMTKVFFRPGKMSEFDQIIRSDPEQVKHMVAKVKSWLIKYRWHLAQYGVWEVIKLKKKIQWRRQNIVTIQKTMRMWIVRKKYHLKIKGLVKLRTLNHLLNQFGFITGEMKSLKKKSTEMISKNKIRYEKLESQIKSLPHRDNIKISIMIDQFRKDLEADMKLLRGEIEKEKTNQEKEKLRKIQEKMEMERKLAEQERQRLAKEEEEKRLKLEMEQNRKKEEEKQKRQELQREAQIAVKSPVMKQQEVVEDYLEEISKEQERRDRELALRVSQNENGIVAEATSTPSFINKQNNDLKNMNIQDVKELQYDELRKIINQSTDVKLIETCQAEFHRRINAFNEWKRKQKHNSPSNSPQISPNPIPTFPISEDLSSRTTTVSPPSTMRFASQRYFKLPFKSSHRKSTNGIWMGHFDGEYIVRQIEIHNETTRILLLAGTDDMAMCELPLSKTGLTTKKGAEITENQFEEIWKSLGGIDLIRQRSQTVISDYLKEKFLKR